MPVFVIHAMGKEPRKAPFDASTVNAGRNQDNELVLPGATVSRQHAVFTMGTDGTWTVRCASETNPIVVDGKLVRADAPVTDGTEILIGAEFLLVFVRREGEAFKYMGGRSVYARSQCSDCNWNGMLSALRLAPICPACGSSKIKRLDNYDRDEAQMEAMRGSTEHVDVGQVRRHLEQIKAAKRSRLERVDNEGGPRKLDMSENETIHIEKKGSGAMKLFGMILGGGLEIAWDGTAFLLNSDVDFPSMKVNGEKTKRARLKSGDLIEVGKNRFRYITE